VDDEQPLHEAERLGAAPPVPESGARRPVRLAAIDLGSLRRHRDYRLLWIGLSVSFFGSQVALVAVPGLQADRLDGGWRLPGTGRTRASAAVGDRRRRPRGRRRPQPDGAVAEGGLALCSMALFVNSLVPSPQVWVLFVVEAFAAALGGFLRPSFDSLTPRLVDRRELTAAGALDSLRFQIGLIGGPAIGGLLIAAIGLPGVFGIDIATFLSRSSR
jgi:MFS family permease